VVPEVVDRVVASGAVPEALLRAGIRAACATRLRRERRLDRKESFIRSLAREPVARATSTANAQHYEVPTEFFRLVLGPRLKYSSCWWPAGVETLADAEDAMLAVSCERAEVEDGMRILDLGCGWGSLTTWLAERYPKARITAVSNSRTQKEWIDRQRHENVEVITADANVLQLPERSFDRVMSVEMLEHMRNYEELLSRVSSWLDDDGKLFVHVFTHRDLAYPYDEGWMTRKFFTAGTMPSHDLLPRFLDVEEDWRIDGTHYARTAEAWLQRLEASRDAPIHVLGSRAAYNEWRVFFLACAELWGYRGGSEWQVSHYRFSKRR
jgi:cyclopropane-fatty-acyl-phospholipid synthase